MYILRKNFLNNFLSLIVILFCLSSTTNAQINWQQTNGPYGATVYDIESSGANLFAGTNGGVFLSTNNGSSWNAVNNGLGNVNINSIAVSSTNIFAGDINYGVFRSNNNGLSWTTVNNGLTSINIIALAVSGTNLFAGTLNAGVFLSTDNGANWSEVNNGLPKNIVMAFAVSGTDLFASIGSSVFLSTNNGSNWSEVNTGLTNNNVTSFAVSGSNIFAGTLNGGIFLSSDKGASWIAVNAGLTTKSIMALAVSGTDLYAGGGGIIFKSTNNGLNWSAVGTGLIYTVKTLKAVGTNIYAGLDGGESIFMSTNSGADWNTANNGLIGTCIRSAIVSGKNLIVGTEDGGAFLSTNNGSNWTSINTGLTGNQILALAISGTNLFAGTNIGVFLSTNNGSSWTSTSDGLPSVFISALVKSGTNLFAGTINGVFLSTNNGSSWSSVNTGLTNTNIQALAVSGSNLIAGTYQGGIFYSTNNGTSWNTAIGLTDADIYSFAVSGTNIFTGTNHGVFLSTNSGSSWYAVNEGINSEYIYSLAISGTKLFAGCDNGVFLSTNMGASWNTVNTGLTNTNVFTLTVSDTCLFAGTWGSGVFIAKLPQVQLPTVKVQTFQKTYGGGGDDDINKFIPIPDGGYIGAAYSTSCTSADIDVCLFKTDSTGNLQWARNFGDSGNDYGSVGVADATGYMIVGCSDVPGREQDMFIARTDLLGRIQWKKTYGGIKNEYGGTIYRTLDGNYVITGNTKSFNSGANDGFESYDGFLMKTDSIGNVLWFKTYARTPEQTDLCNDVLEESDGSFVMTGATYEWGDHDMMLVKTDSNGNLIWSKKYHLPYHEMGNRIVKASNGDYLVVAESGPTTTDRAAVLYRIDPAGNLLWTKTYRSPASGRTFNSARGVTALSDGGIIIEGKWAGSGVDNNSSGFILKSDSIGNVVWCREYIGSNTEFSWSVYQTGDGGFVLGGHTNNSGNGGKDCYLVKTDENGMTAISGTIVDPIVETPYVSTSTVEMICSTQSVTGLEGQFLRESDGCFNSGPHPSNDLIAYYPFNGNAYDASGNGYNAISVNATLATDRFGNSFSAYNFDGNTNLIDFGDILDEVFCKDTAQFSISGWAFTRAHNPKEGNLIIGKSAGGVGPYQWSTSHNGGVLYGQVFTDSKAHNYLTGQTSMGLNEWFHFVLVFDGKQPVNERLKYYVNGILVASDNITGMPGTTTENTGLHLTIGGINYFSSQSSFYNGLIDDIRIYNRILTQNEIDTLYHEGGWNPTTPPSAKTLFSLNVGGPVYAGISILGDNAMYAIASGDAVYKMNTSGSVSYTLQVSGEVRSSSSIAYDTTLYIASSDKNLYAFSKDGNSVWPPLPTGGILTATPTIDSISNRIYIGVSNHNFIAVNRSTGSVVWNYFADDQINNSAVITRDRKLIFATQKGTMYGFQLNNLSSPVAPNWQISLPYGTPSSIALDDEGYIYFGTSKGWLFKILMLTDQQPSIIWQVKLGGAITGSPVIDMTRTLYVGSLDSNLYAINIQSGAVKWTFSTDGAIRSTPAISDAGHIFVANDNGEILSIDTSKNIIWHNRINSPIEAPLMYYKSALYIGTLGNQVIALSDVLDSINIQMIYKSDNFSKKIIYPIWATYQGNNQRTGTFSSYGISGITNPNTKLPTSYKLSQNYPNPFNPSTTIAYELPVSSLVEIKIYNIVGQEIMLLKNKFEHAGYHDVIFDSSSLPSGIYFYRMKAGSFSCTKKMILLK